MNCPTCNKLLFNTRVDRRNRLPLFYLSCPEHGELYVREYRGTANRIGEQRNLGRVIIGYASLCYALMTVFGDRGFNWSGDYQLSIARAMRSNVGHSSMSQDIGDCPYCDAQRMMNVGWTVDRDCRVFD